MITSNVVKYTKTDEPVPDLPSSAGTTDSIAPTEPGMVAAANTGPTNRAEVTSSAAGIESVTAAAAAPVTKIGIGIDAMPNTSGTTKLAPRPDKAELLNKWAVETRQAELLLSTKPASDALVLVTSSAAGIESVTATAAAPVTEIGTGIDVMASTSKTALVVSTKQQKALDVICNFGTKPDLAAELLPVNKHDSKKRDSMDGNKMVQCTKVIDLVTPDASTGGRNGGTPTFNLSPGMAPSDGTSPDSQAALLKLIALAKAGDLASKVDLHQAAHTLGVTVVEKVTKRLAESERAVVSAVNTRSSETDGRIASELAATRECVEGQHKETRECVEGQHKTTRECVEDEHKTTREMHSKGMDKINKDVKENRDRTQQVLNELEETRNEADERGIDADAVAAATAVEQDATLAALLAAVNTNGAAAAAAAADQKTATDAILAVSNANLAASKASLAELQKIMTDKAAATKDKKAANKAIKELEKERAELENKRLDLLASGMEANRVSMEELNEKINEINEKVVGKKEEVDVGQVFLNFCAEGIAKLTKKDKDKTRAIPAAKASTTTQAAPPSTRSRATGPTAPTVSSDAKQANIPMPKLMPMPMPMPKPCPCPCSMPIYTRYPTMFTPGHSAGAQPQGHGGPQDPVARHREADPREAQADRRVKPTRAWCGMTSHTLPSST